MSYALLARDDAGDPEAGPPSLPKARGLLPSSQPFSNGRLLIRTTPRLKVLLAAITITLLGLSVYKYGPGSTFRPGVSLPPALREDDSDQWFSTYRVRPRLPFVQEDGEHAPLKEGTLPARWPQDYPEAATYLHENSILRDVKDPWPEKPWIASIWLAPERFPPGLQGQPHDSTPLPEIGKENGKKPPPGLHDPPLPEYPAEPPNARKLESVPREQFVKPKNWRAPSGLPRPAKTAPVQSRNFDQDDERKALVEARRQWVKRAFLHAYEGYKFYAFGHDEVSPISRGARDSYNAWGATTVDSLDLLLIMDLSHEYNVARTHVRSLDFTLLMEKRACNAQAGPTVHLFETVIRYLGGFLSAYDLSQDELMLRRARELGDWLLPAFNTASGWPVPFYPLGKNPNGTDINRILAAEVGSLSMELTRLSQVTGDQAYYNAALRIQDSLAKFRGEYGTLVSHFLSPNGGHGGDFTIGGMIDSYYEYMIKMVQLLGSSKNVWGTMYEKAVNDIYRYLAVNVTITPDRSGVVTIGARSHNSKIRAMEEHLATFAGGMFGLGSRLLSRTQDLLMGIELTESAVWAYRSTATGLMPEIMEFYEPLNQHRVTYLEDQNGARAVQKGIPLGSSYQPDREYKGRPEAIESVFYMYRITGDPKWQDYGWRMFTSWVKHSLTSVGFANIHDVNQDPPSLIDVQESFVLTETMKYYYLLFSPPDLISLDDYVFNTEAHPFKVPLRVHRTFWAGPELDVDAAYADPRDQHLFGGVQPMPEKAPVGRGTAKQQQWQVDNCSNPHKTDSS